MIKSINFLFISLIFSVASAAEFCPSNSREFVGENITFSSKSMQRPVNYLVECNNAKAVLSTYCSTYASADTAELCDKGQVLACRFCKPSRTPICNYDHLPMDYPGGQLTRETCEVLESSGNALKRDLSEKVVCDIRLNLIKLAEIFSDDLTTLTSYEREFLIEHRNSFIDATKAISLRLEGKSGFRGYLSQLGRSDTTVRLINESSGYLAEWRKLRTQIQNPSSLNDETFNQMKAGLESLKRKVLVDLRNEFVELKYKPEGAEEAVPCK